MLQSLKAQWKRGADTLSRRELFRRSALLTLPGLFRGQTAEAMAAARRRPPTGCASARTSTNRLECAR
jgi:hypothetical protein